MTFFSLVCLVGFLSSCSDEVTLKTLPYIFRPVNFNATLNGTSVTVSWAKVDSAVSYTLEVSKDSVLFLNPVIKITTPNLNYTQELAGATSYFARIRANASDSTKSSKFNQTLSFKTPSENIFGVNIPVMTALHTIDVKWQPKANVTKLVLTASDNTVTNIAIPADAALAGEISIPDLANANYTVQIYNNDILRGNSSILVEGDYLLKAGDDLPTTMTNATPGQVIILSPGVSFAMGGGTYRLGKNIKVRGLLPGNLPVISMTTGTPTVTSSMLGFVDGSLIDYIKFENLDFAGYCENNTAAVKIGYLFNNNVMTNVKSLSFKNCKLHNFGNTPMRVQGGRGQIIDTLTFNKCVINDIGFSSTYAIVNSNSADFINNINFTNSTVYNFKGSLVLRTGQTLSSITISNCTINQGMQDPGSARYLIDANTAVFQGTGSITIKNSILGQTGGLLGANGMRYVTGTPVAITGCYFTSDYVDDPVPIGATSTSIKASMTAYSGASTALWNGPTTGDFNLKDTAFKGKGVAGDLRWY